MDSKRHIPKTLIIILFSISLFFTVKSIFNYFSVVVKEFSNQELTFVLFGNPLSPSIVELIIATIIFIYTWLLSTKVERFKELKWKLTIFINMIVGVTVYYIWLTTAAVSNGLIPYLQAKINQIDINNVWMAVMLGNTSNLMITILFIPTAAVLLILLWVSSQYSLYSEPFIKAFQDFEFRNKLFQRFAKLEYKESEPDIVLGPDSKSKEEVIQYGKDRTLNSLIIGAIGTGKTSALVLPILNQDLYWMTKFINEYPVIYQQNDYSNIRGSYLNGISVIEPSNDLCQKVYQLVKAHNIPEEAIFYIDPTNPDTKNINVMQGPVDQVAEAVAMVVDGLSESGESNFFFEQSQRNHLKNYIYLLKLHNPEAEVIFDDLLEMYDNPQLVRKMHVRLKETFPSGYLQIEKRDERNHWKIVKQIDEWFDANLLPVSEKNGTVRRVTEGEYRGEIAYFDAQAEYVKGLRNILNDIGANKLIRRVLFGKSDFDFDRHLEYGGVLLVNTAKGELAGLSNVLGKFVLLSLQNAVFRRKPNTSTYHHILVDEFPDYIYRPFKEFPAQSRKYKTIITVVAQTISQLADKYGEMYLHTLLGALRNKMVYGDIPDYDAMLFSRIFGEKEQYEESSSEQTVSPLQENPITRAGMSYSRVKQALLSPSDLIYQEAFQCAIKIVVNNKPVPVTQINANFVPKEEFENAIKKVQTEAGELWLSDQLQFDSSSNSSLAKQSPEQEIIIDENTEFLSNHNMANEKGELDQFSIQKPEASYPLDYGNSYVSYQDFDSQNQEVLNQTSMPVQQNDLDQQGDLDQDQLNNGESELDDNAQQLLHEVLKTSNQVLLKENENREFSYTKERDGTATSSKRSNSDLDSLYDFD
ncbi:type IV secretory system conjugative DNA transfer family protein [Bacillus swezeyi]|uniref:Conjugal transfer protein TraG n=1 Tax=Bacillus swezeyi TaxID=1925020 RepID=A0A5M8RHJ4_9BACI|nr:type IV secretory system conjugative DNA transfer family protein [Bacillus swezeyi]KAA6446908.1 conjugal transfer protein TraG [Bacillus swezeyi]KAA6471476.1 conjugal transfer protein TraG [Bacillus swezeyi]